MTVKAQCVVNMGGNSSHGSDLIIQEQITETTNFESGTVSSFYGFISRLFKKQLELK